MTQILISSTFGFSVLKPGDSIGVKVNASSGLLANCHLGIYLGNEEVIDYTIESTVRKISLEVFTENNTQELYRINYKKAPAAYKPEVIMETAMYKYSNQDFGHYNAITNNCAHFVTYCTFGKRFSLQIDKTVKSAFCVIV